MKTFWQFISEVKTGDIAKIGARVNRFSRQEFDEEPFNDIFGNKFRIVIPLLTEEEIHFFDTLERLGLKDVDIHTGMGKKETTSQKGKKDVSIRIGKFIQLAAKSEPDLDDLLHWYEKNKKKMARPVEERRGVSIIISRHPIDIIRMSDHAEFDSCHSPGRGWFQCAVSEAQKGGGIAYIVRNRDLDTVKNMQAKEIFKDKDRGVVGIEPLERIRLRRFNDGEHDYLIPEERSYGVGHVGLESSIRQWARSVQADGRLDDPDFDNMTLIGGTHQDTDASALWSEFLGRSVRIKNIKIERGKAGLTDERVEEIVAGHTYKHFHVDANVEESDGMEYVSYRGYVAYEFPIQMLARKLPKYDAPEYKDVRVVQDALRAADLDVYTVDEIELTTLEKPESRFVVQVSLRDEQDAGTLQSLEEWLDDIDEYDKEYEEQKHKVFFVLWVHGWLKNELADADFKYLELVEDPEAEVSTYARRTHIDAKYVFKSPAGVVGSLAGVYEDDISVQQGQELYDMTDEKSPGGSLSMKLLHLLRNKYFANKFPGAEVELNVSMKASQEVQASFGFDTQTLASNNPHRRYAAGNIIMSFLVVAGDTSPATVSAMTVIDDLLPTFVKEARQFLAVVMERAQKSHVQQNYINPYMKDLFVSKLASAGQEGEIYIRDSVLWYKDVQGGIDAPLAEFFDRVQKDVAVYNKHAKLLAYRLWRNGHVVIKYQGGQPHPYWWDDQTRKSEPLDAAMKRHSKGKEHLLEEL